MSGFEELNREINNRIQELSEIVHLEKHTRREYNELAALIYPKLRFFVWKFCKNEIDTEEALHFALVKIFKNICKYNPCSGRFTTWAFTIARNETLYYLDRKNKDIPNYIELSMLFIDSKYNDNIAYVEKSTNHNEVTDIFNSTILEIYNLKDDLLKNIAIDKMVNNEKVKEIAEKYDIPENTVKTKLRKARFEIRKSFLKKDPDINRRLVDSIQDFKIKQK
jgi:RNA polymerase sigma factor (sigma-70 family)